MIVECFKVNIMKVGIELMKQICTDIYHLQMI